MESTDDSSLLRQYGENGADDAFAELVARHINLVYSVALRRVGNSCHAEEITQAVFIILAKKAASLRHEKALSSWLFQATHLTANNFARSEARRLRREQEAYMQSTFDQPGSDSWQRIGPLLDNAVEALNEKDRQAIILRFYEGRNLHEVGIALGTSEEAAKKRVMRAVEKLQRFFHKRGVASTATTLSGIISANSVHAAPVALAKTVTAVSIAKGASASGSILALVKGGLKIMAWTKMKIAAVAGVSVLLAVAGGMAIYEANWNSEKAAGGPADMKINWLVGKKYALHVDLVQSAETKSPDQARPLKEGFKWTQDFAISALNDLPDGGRHLELEFVSEAINTSSDGRGVLSFDSTRNRAVDARNRLAIVGAIVGKRLEYFIDADGKVQKVEGADELMAHVAAIGTPPQQEFFKGAFGGDTLKNLLAIGEMMPNRMINVGESWSVTKDVTDPIGLLTATLQFTFKNWEKHGGRRCAHIKKTGDLSSKTVSTASVVAVEIMKGKYSGDLWFDPELGMVIGSTEDQDLILKITSGTQTLMKQTHNNSQMTLVNVQ